MTTPARLTETIGAARKAATLAVAGAAAAFTLAAPAAAQDMPRITAAGQLPPIFEYVYRHYAITGGFFEEEGLDAEAVGFTAGLTGMQALVTGDVDFACEGLLSILGAIREGADIKVVVTVNADNTYTVVARDRVSGVPDIEGRTWAISRMGAISQTYAALWAGESGLDVSTITWVPIGGNTARARAVLADQVDAAMLTYGEFLRISEEEGIKSLGTLPEVLPPLPISVCATSSRMIEESPEIVQAYVNGVLDTVRHARTEEGKAEYIALAKELGAGDFTDAQYDALWEFYLGPDGSPNAMDPNGGMYPEVIHRNMEMAIADGVIEEKMPLTEIWDPTFVNEYLGENGWYDVKTNTAGHFLIDLIAD